MRALAISFALLLTASGNVFAAAGDLDATFGDRGTVITRVGENDIAYAIGRQADGKLLVAGFVEPDEIHYVLLLLRYDANGALDPTFGTGGVVQTPIGGFYPFARAVFAQADGDIVVVARVSSADGDVAVLRYDSSGTLDPTFGGGDGIALAELGDSGDVAAAVQQPDGKIVVATDTSLGISDPSGGDVAVLRFDTEGNLDPSFGSGGVATIDFDGMRTDAIALVLEPSGAVVVTGFAWIDPHTLRSGTYVALARLDEHGVLDPAFGSGGKVLHSLGHPVGTYDAPTALLRLADGTLIVAGQSNQLDPVLDFSVVETDPFFLRFDAAGNLDATLGGGTGILWPTFRLYGVNELALDPDGKIVAIGGSETAAYGGAMGAARFESDLTPDLTFGDGGETAAVPHGFDSYTATGLVDGDGNIVAAGLIDEACPNGDIYGLCYHVAAVRFTGAVTPCASDADCGACESCGAAGACVFGARASCVPASYRGASLTIATPPGRLDKHGVQLKWKGSTPLGFDPTTGDDVGLCLYVGGKRVLKVIAPAGGVCAGKPCWSGNPTAGFAYKDRDRTPDGMLKVRLTAKNALLDARGQNLIDTMHGLPNPAVVGQNNSSVLAQVHGGNGACFGATISDLKVVSTHTSGHGLAFSALRGVGQ